MVDLLWGTGAHQIIIMDDVVSAFRHFFFLADGEDVWERWDIVLERYYELVVC